MPQQDAVLQPRAAPTLRLERSKRVDSKRAAPRARKTPITSEEATEVVRPPYDFGFTSGAEPSHPTLSQKPMIVPIIPNAQCLSTDSYFLEAQQTSWLPIPPTTRLPASRRGA